MSIVEDEDAEGLYAWKDGLPCPTCFTVLPAEDAHFDAFFRTGKTTCIGSCGGDVDWWDAALRRVEEMPPSWMAFRLLGGIQSSLRVRIEPEKYVGVTLEAAGVPADAEILNVQMTTIGSADGPIVRPLPVVPGDLRFDPFPRSFGLYGAGYGQAPSVSHALIVVTWLQPGPNQVVLHHLGDAARQLTAGRNDGVIVPANIAAEAAIGTAIHEWVRLSTPKDNADRLLGDRGVSYSHQLNTIVRIASSTLELPDMPGRVRNLLDQLRQYRNDLVHGGVLDKKERPPLTRKKATEFLTAAVFGYRYARFLQTEVARRRETMPQGKGPAQ